MKEAEEVKYDTSGSDKGLTTMKAKRPYKSFYDEEFKNTDEAIKFRDEVIKAVKPIAKKYIKKGYHPTEIDFFIKESLELDMTFEALKLQHEKAKRIRSSRKKDKD